MPVPCWRAHHIAFFHTERGALTKFWRQNNDRKIGSASESDRQPARHRWEPVARSASRVASRASSLVIDRLLQFHFQQLGIILQIQPFARDIADIEVLLPGEQACHDIACQTVGRDFSGQPGSCQSCSSGPAKALPPAPAQHFAAQALRQ